VIFGLKIVVDARHARLVERLALDEAAVHVLHDGSLKALSPTPATRIGPHSAAGSTQSRNPGS
jgi:hypothetical protein